MDADIAEIGREAPRREGVKCAEKGTRNLRQNIFQMGGAKCRYECKHHQQGSADQHMLGWKEKQQAGQNPVNAGAPNAVSRYQV